MIKDTVKDGSIRYTIESIQYVAEPGTSLYDSIIDKAQERWNKVTRTFVPINRTINMPTLIDETFMGTVRLDGQIVPWWRAADRERGWVDVWANLSDDDLNLDLAARLHRLFGIVTFEAKTVTL